MKNWKTVFFALLFSQSLIASTSEDLLKNLKSRFTDLPKGQGALMKSFTHHGQSYIYDQALGIIAFTNAGRQDDAKKLLTALRVLQHKDGSLYFSYYLDGSSPYPTEGDKRIAGAISWVALASVHYQAKFNSHEFKEFNKQFQLKLIGAVSAEVLQSIKEFGLNNHVNHLGYLPHHEAIMEQRSSQVLLLIEIDSQETRCIIPGKLFEYMVTERPIIAIGPEHADFAQIIKETNTGTFFKYDELKALKTQILYYFEQFQQNNLKVFPVGLQQYSRISLTEKLAKLLIIHH